MSDEELYISNKSGKAIQIDTISEDGVAEKMGRMCCGGRCMTVKKGDEVIDAMYIEQTNFKGYSCMVDWFFLHIEEDRDAVYHHQTCMARYPDAPKPELDEALFGDIVHRFTDEKGPICTISKGHEYLDWLEAKLASENPPEITCPNNHCGCGVCVLKSNNKDMFDLLKTKYVDL